MLTGGSGLLGTQMLKDHEDIYAPTHKDLDICSIESCVAHAADFQPDVLIHAAAYTSPPRCDENPMAAVEVNVKGTMNLVRLCSRRGTRLVYISTDYVFDGENGPYGTDDPINPVNKYAMTKAAGELVVRTMDNSLVIRTSFCENEFPYDKAFEDQYTSRDYVDIIAPLIYNIAVAPYVGIAHIGTERKSVYDLARQRKNDVGKLSINDVNFSIPKDTSFRL